MIGDAFHGPESQPDYWKGFYPLPQYEGCALDSHVYTIFDDNSIRLKSADRINVYCSRKQAYANADKNLYEIIGEWTPVFTDCARNLNGRGTGSRYEGTLSGSRGRIGSCGPKTGSGATFTDGYKRLLGRFWEAQASAYEGGSGWIMWTWKTESADEWSYQAGVKYGWIPKDPTARPFGETCN